MAKPGVKLLALAAIGLALVPALAHADVRIEEQATTLDAKVKRWIAIKGDRRALVTRAEPTGTLYNAGARYGAYVEIARPDKELIWDLDPQERSYREVPAPEFIRLLQKGIQPPRNANDQPLRTLYQSQTTAIEVVPTGKTRKIAGFEAEQVLARVVVGAQNQVSGNQFNFTFDQEIWITKDERLVKELHTFEDAYFDQFGTAATLQQAQTMAGSWNDAFITHLRAVNDRVRALQGVPLAVTTTVTEEAVAQTKGEKSSARKLTVGTVEVKKITLESIPDREFELPVGYINQDTKVAVAPGPDADPKVAVAPVPMPKPEPVTPPTPVAVAVAKPPVTPEPVAVEKPTKPELPVAAVAPPVKPAAPVPAEAPVIPQVRPGTVVVTPAPTNVVVRGADGVLPSVPKNSTAARPGGVFIPSYSPPVPGNNVPVLGAITYTTTRTPPPPVVIDEPDLGRGKKRRR
jgi:hypothetical protein